MSNGERNKKAEGNGYKYRGTSEYNKIKESEMKNNFRREYFKRTKLIMKIRLNGSKSTMAVNT